MLCSMRLASLLYMIAIAHCQLFYHRSWHSSVVVGDYLYIDGGEIGTWNGTGNITYAPNNLTYSIDLSSSWTNKTVLLTGIEKLAPTFQKPALWVDESNVGFYAYNGEVSQSLPSSELPVPAPNELWRFSQNGSGGSWSQISFSADSNFTSLVRVGAGLTTYGNGTGYVLGGYQSWHTTAVGPVSQSADFIPVPGLISYNIMTQSWANSSATGYSTYGTAYNGHMHYVPSFGSASLLVAVGGQTSYPSLWQDYQNLVSFKSISIYDTVSDVWKAQTATGQVPPPRLYFCSVGIQGDNGTYEIYIHGGAATDSEESVSLDSIYVLSLPSFVWQQASYTPRYDRKHHTCNVIGNRQMVVIGGDPSQNGTPNAVPDPWPQGLGIFDLSEMVWKAQYDALALPYVTPNIIRVSNEAHGAYPDKWDDPLVKSWFVPKVIVANNTVPSNSTAPIPPAKSENHIGAIAGGVVGGLLGVVLASLLAFFVVRDRRRQTTCKSRAELVDQKEGPSEVQGFAHQQASELQGKSIFNQTGGVPIHELPARQY